MDKTAIHSSDRERLAEEAERDSVELKKIQFMERHVGDIFEGVITGVEVFGFFVELKDYHVSGLVHVNNMKDDYYEFWEESFALVGSSTGKKFTLGDTVKVQVLAVNKELRQIDFLLEEMVQEAVETPRMRLQQARTEFEGKGRKKPPPSRLEERNGRGKKAGKGSNKGKARGRSR